MNTTIKINDIDVEIRTINGEQYIALKPICSAIGLDYASQFIKIKKDPILSTVYKVKRWTVEDNKERKMVVISYKYMFGWLFQINPKFVKPELRESFLSFQKECFDALIQKKNLREF